jgi:hypothetical protein
MKRVRELSKRKCLRKVPASKSGSIEHLHQGNLALIKLKLIFNGIFLIIYNNNNME